MSSQRLSSQRPESNGPVPTRNYIAVARGSDLVLIRVIGAGNMLNAPALAEFSDEQRRAGFKRFVFDLERCTGLDSTFMGVMVGLYTSMLRPAQESSQQPAVPSEPPPPDTHPVSPEDAVAGLKNEFTHNKEQLPTRSARVPLSETRDVRDDPLFGAISAVNVSADIRGLLGMLGVDKFVKICGSCDLTKLETTMLPEKQIAPVERRKLILKAHETLVEIDKRNEAQFGGFLKTLAAELNK